MSCLAPVKADNGEPRVISPLMLLGRAQDNHALRRIVPDQLQNTPGVLSTKTFLIFEDAEN